MKKFKLYALAALAALSLGACSDDDPIKGGGQTNPNDKEVTDGVYFTIDIQMPTAGGSRSTTEDPVGGVSTSSSGVEVGKTYENKVNSALVVLAEAGSNRFIAAARVSGSNLVEQNIGGNANNPGYKVTSAFSKTDLANYYNGTTGDKIFANIFVFCNPNQDLIADIYGVEGVGGATLGSSDWINETLTYQDANSRPWETGGQNTGTCILMSNAVLATRQLPSTLNGWNYYTTSDKPFNLSGNNLDTNIDNGTTGQIGGTQGGPIRVERAVARFDFRDGSQDEGGNGAIGTPLTYNVLMGNSKEMSGKPLVQVELQYMYLVNVNKLYYAIRRVSADGMEDNASICMPEIPDANYVVDADATWKVMTARAFQSDPNQSWPFKAHFMSPFFNDDNTINHVSTDGTWATAKCSDILSKNDEDNDITWGGGSKGYHIWRYATENTIPGPVTNQVNGISTGVVFKAKLKATADALKGDKNEQDLAKAFSSVTGDWTKDPVLYSVAGNLFCSWPNLREAAINAAIPGFHFVEKEDGTVTYGDVKGEWEPISINRSATLYAACFGTGGFGEVTFTATILNEDGTVKEEKEITYTDTLAEAPDCADYLWEEWQDSLKSSTATEEDQLAALNAFRKVATGDGPRITIYQSSIDDEAKEAGYFCYYYYWNRHDDNGNPGVMGPMEFAVVRNNVYKLAVTKISQLGHPRIPQNDPFRPNGGTPDESENVYLTVQAQILPWVVRVNNIEF